MAQEILKKIFAEMIDGLSERAPDGDKAGIEGAYMEYLEAKYGPLIEVLQKETGDEEKTLSALLVMEENKWKGMPGDYVLSVLFPDKAFSVMQQLSSLALQKAIDRKKTGAVDETDFTYEAFEGAIEKCLGEIKDYNREAAGKLLSETILDIRFAYGKSDMMSLRLARMV